MMGKLQMSVGKLLLHDSSSNMFKRTSKKKCVTKNGLFTQNSAKKLITRINTCIFFKNSEACKSNYENS